MNYRISYKYINPHPSGPFKGHTETKERLSKGDEIWAVFGRAIVISCRKLKTESSDPAA